MNKYSKELAEMLGSDVAEVISAWMNEELQKLQEAPAGSRAPVQDRRVRNGVS